MQIPVTRPERGPARHRRVLSSEGQVLLDELDVHALPGEIWDNLPEVIQVSSQSVHAVGQQQITLT